MKPRDQVLRVWGEFACFSEIKAERFSYPVITPSAARGIYDAIYCKPNRDPTQAQCRWQVTRIDVLALPSYIALRRNEVGKKAPSERTVLSWMAGTVDVSPIIADEDRQQRQTMALRNVAYVLHAEIRPWPGFEERLSSFEAQFRRRAARGQCVWQPYLGCREFPAYFELLEPNAPAPEPASWSADLGFMLYDVFDLSRPGTPDSPWQPSLFRAVVHDGVLVVPDYDSDQVLKVGEA